MLDINFIRDNSEQISAGACNKNMELNIGRLLQLDTERRRLIVEVEALRARKNEGSREISSLKGPEKMAAIEAMKNTSASLKKLEPELEQVKAEFTDLMLRVPMPPSADVPIGRDEAENVEIRCEGSIASFDFEPKDHLELAEMHDLIDMPRASRISGSRQYFLKREAALLELSVMRMALDLVTSRGFVPVIPPALVRDQAMTGTGYFPIGEEQAYRCERDGLNLIGTSEVPLAAYYSDEILAESELPVRLAGWSPCFRREAGTYGRDTRGVYRIHQFSKVEQVIISAADQENSRQLHEELLKNAEDLVKMLEIPYRIVAVCTGDLGIGQVRKHDIECWMPGRNGYGETHSCSTFHDFQARRLNIRYRGSGQERPQYCFTLNNTVVASPRILIPLLENHQQSDGTVIIPDALRPYMGGITRIGGKA